jgi:surface carbohydrate biosynthesis protein
MNAEKIKILIPIEVSSREMLYKIYLCNVLTSQGFECFLGSKSEIDFLIEEFNGFIYIDKGFHKGNSENIHKKIIKNNGVIVSLDEEGAVDFEDGSTLKVRYSEKLFEASNVVFFWGKYQFQIIKDIIKIKSKCIISGHPRFELLKKEFHFLYEDDLVTIKKKYGDYILINTNMGFGNNIRGDEFIVKNYVDRFKNIKKIINNDKIKLNYFISLISKLSDLEYNIVVRPHPEEDTKIYKDLFGLKKNIFITNYKSVIPWIIGCETMIHSDCTTGIESLMLGKKSIAFVPNELDKEFLTILPLKASRVIDNEVEILNFIKNKKYNINVVFSDYPWLKNNFNFPGESFEIISQAFREFKFITDSNNLKFKGILLKNMKNNVKILLRGKDKLIARKSKDFNYIGVKEIHSKIVKSNTKFKDNTVNKIFNELYCFKKNRYE